MKLFTLQTGLLVLFSIKAFTIHAQDDIPPSAAPLNYYKSADAPRYGLYVSGGITTPYTDVKSPLKNQYIFGVEGRYAATHYLDLALDLQMGKLEAGKIRNGAGNAQMQFNNQIFNVVALARFSPMKLMKNIPFVNSPIYYFSNLYIGTGIGMVKSKVEANVFKDSDFDFIGNYTGSDIIIPVELGINLPVFQLKNNEHISVNLNYRVNFSLGDKLDGYSTPRSVNRNNDVYNTLTLGVGYSF